MRVQPKPWIGIAVLLAYLAVFYGVWIAGGIDYARIAESESTLLHWYVLPLASGAVVLIAAASLLGWWKPVLFEKERAPLWLVVAPVAMVAGAFLILSSKDLSGTTATMLVYLVLGSLLVGFCEETATRGILIVGLRGRLTEPLVWLVSCALFGLMHLPNWIFGAGPGAMLQVVLTFCLGSVLYVARRSTGTLIVPMLLHGLWDFSTFSGRYTTGTGQTATMLLTFAVCIAGLIFVAFALRGVRGRRLGQLG
ncbi:CPBP family intramembrane glutamic endopeptidase [Tessaracoccus palaemonis]|uniref:CPBP family intramembrane metalloprotease n=1 Tax=Tessaracoccus palaemonis TaxID=2829499 RepID=A0ABX8SME3_9ACTN|nr:type II CAAX endopeptidase family protein [Tessaracoccus palaemonis]QXT63572.1 CPBP family intramembrane metalloprotease [Tessaracoccus palaemonis]